MSANSDDAVDALAAYVRARFAAPLAHIQTPTAVATAASTGVEDAPRDALVPALRSSSTSAPPAPDAAAWKRVLLMVFRRFAGQLVVRGKLLNQEELLVSHFCRVDVVTSGRPHDPCARIPESLSSLRFVLPCEDGRVEQVGRDDVIARVKPSSYPASSSSAEVVVVVCSTGSTLDEEDPSVAIITPSMWEDARALTDLDMLYGFDVRYLLQAHSAMVARMADENADSANALIASAPVFSDLRCTQVMMRSYDIQQSSSAMGRFASFAVEEGGSDAPASLREEHPRSYISLGRAQMKRWADERLASGQELAGKGRIKDALAEFASCLKLDEEHVGAFFARAETFASLQQFPDAIRDLEVVKRLDPAFPGVDAALLRARSKLKHSRHVEIPSSLPAVGSKGSLAPVSAGNHSLKSRSGSKAHSDDYSKSVTLREKSEKAAVRSTSPCGKERRRRSQSFSSSSLPNPPAAETEQHQSKKKLERDRLRRLLEEEVGGERGRKEKRHRRKKSTRARSSSEEEESDDTSDGRTKRRRKSSSLKKKKKRKHDEKREKSSRKSKKKHRRRRRDESSSDSSSEDSDSSSDSDRSEKTRRKKKKSRNSRRDRRSASGGREKEDEPTKEEPHPILARQRHRIWN